MTLETARLTLASWQPSDWPLLRPLAQDPEVMRYITGGAAWTDDQIRSFVDRQVLLEAHRGVSRWKLLERQTGEFIGFCGAGVWRDRPDLEIGWWLARPHWGRGLATEAAQEALHDLFERAGMERVISVAMVENRASLRVMEKLGLRFQHEFANEGFRLAQYGLERSEYMEFDRKKRVANGHAGL